MYAGRLTPAAIPGVGGEPAGIPAGGAAEGRGDPVELPRPRRPPRVDRTDHRSRRHRAGHRRHRALDPAGYRAGRAARGDGGRTPRAAGRPLICESYVTFCKSKPWQEACASSLTELFAPKIHQQRIEAFPVHYPWIPPEGLDYFKSRLVQAPRDVSHGLRIVQRVHHDARAAAAGVRGAGVQAGDAVGHDRHDPQRLPRGLSVALTARRRVPRALAARAAGLRSRRASGPCCSTRRAPCC